ncbi:dihydrodipicolinate synthase family protein [Photobacterium sp. TY1-4]|uniref:dihydrodipicolinate synthase family protein n=1 Tax=Photobacterium sp. TY1-4 TaxID=2899122 RepID=UPI0021C1AF88|nr:dihydrodipicolinate synthase family protein [Photobacterium sp. TY1-4]UXI03089.1 dihydrodipicolinate synthase family protein [Photobacterium sp. TY1-4]
MFNGLCAFPLTPLNQHGVDEAAFIRLIERLVAAEVDSICVLGSTGNYAYLSRAERAQVIQLAVQHAGHIPVMAGISALATRDVLDLAQDAQQAGADAVLLAPMSYQKLTADEVFGLYETVAHALSIPLCVYDNPGTTQFEFSDELHGRIAQLPNVAAIKIPPVPAAPEAAKARVDRLRALVPPHVSLGISGDVCAATGIAAGCETWYSVIGGLFPHTALTITRAAQNGDTQTTAELSAQLEGLWALFRQYGSLRVVATAAEILALADSPCLPAPLQALEGRARQQLVMVLESLSLE